MSIAQNLNEIEKKIGEACARSGRTRASVKLLAVSKLQSIEKIREAYEWGQRAFAENYAQEAISKQELLADLKDISWHFIGRIQSNKVKMLAGRFAVIHSVESLKIADFFNRTEERQDILLQFNVAHEASKGGLEEKNLFSMCEALVNHQNIRLLGLMVMPPLVANAEEVRPYFRKAAEVLQRIRDKVGPEVLSRHPLTELSMGTSQDFMVAIEEGATWIRLGTNIFGSRP